MHTKNAVLLIILLTNCNLTIYSQSKIINSKVNYTHKETGYVFPLHLDNFTRTSILANDKSKKNISLTYKNPENGTIISISLYPAGRGTEGRLRDEYLNSFNSLVTISTPGIIIEHSPAFFENNGYRVNGYRGQTQTDGITTALTLLECGKWFFRVRTTSKILDKDEIYQLESRIINKFCPTNLVKLSPLIPKVDIYFGKAAFADSLFLGCIMGSALRKIEWMMEEIDSLELISGFPDIYLEMHLASIKAIVQFAEENPSMSRGQRTDEYLSQIRLLIDSGYLEEYIIEIYDRIMKVPNNIELDLEGYIVWKEKNKIDIDLSLGYYILVFIE